MAPAPAPAIRTGRATQEAAAQLIVDPWRKRGFGFRMAAIGASGSGKSFFCERLIEYALRSGAADFAFVYDHKDPRPSFKGAVRRDVDDFVAHPPTPDDGSVIVFHEDGPGDPDSVAQLGLTLGLPCVVDIDELFPDAVSRGGQEFINGATSPLATLLRAGRSRGASAMFCTQLPQKMPTEVSDLCESVAIFRLQNRGLAYVDERRLVVPKVLDVVRRLKMGEFVLVRDGECDGTVYGPE